MEFTNQELQILCNAILDKYEPLQRNEETFISQDNEKVLALDLCERLKAQLEDQEFEDRYFLFREK